MSDISKINPNGTEYNLKDATARAGIESSKTLKSSVVTVTDAAPINAEDITVDIAPVQDLHGYDRPWAGGAGKNKLPMTVEGIKAVNTRGTWSGNTYTLNGVTFEILVDSDNNVTGIKVNGTASAESSLNIVTNFDNVLTVGTSYILNGCPSGGSDNTYLMFLRFSGSDVGNGLSFVYGGISGTYLGIIVKSGVSISNKVFYPMIRLATEQDSTFAPYSNICPIEGRTGAELDRVGKNLISRTGGINQYGVYEPTANAVCSDILPTASGKKFIASKAMAFSASWSNLFAILYDENKNYISQSNIMAYSALTGNAYTVPNGAYFIAFSVYLYAAEVTNIASYKLQVEEGTQPTTYEPYQGQQYTASFGETVYGGKWHVTAGGTDKTHANIDNYNGETINEPWLSSMDEYVAGATPTTGAQVVYPLTTPTTISTPKQNVPMLEGINTVSADCGDTQLKYQPDNVIGELKGEIEDSIIYEDFKWTTESSQSYSAGTPGTYGTSCWRDVKKEGYDVIGVTFVGNRRFGDCILTLYYVPSTSHVEVIIFRATSSSVTIADEDIVYRVAYKKH